MDFKFLLYIFSVAVIIAGGAYYFFSSGQAITAMMVFAGMLVAAIYFGFRWFTPSGETTGAGYRGSWPPVINYCPDFLSLYTIDNKQVCIDPIGVTSGTLKKWTDPTQTSNDYLFELHLDKAGKLRTEALCQECAEKGVTWEGVYDGSVCLYQEPPRPPAASS